MYINSQLVYNSPIQRMILIIGDLHFKVSNTLQSAQLFSQVKQLLSENEICHVFLLGDVMHYHEKLDTRVQNVVVDFVSMIISYCNVTILVGNHDMVNNQVYCDSKGHWMNIFDGWVKVVIVDKPKIICADGKSFCCVPYVYPGRFAEALRDFDINPNDHDFCLAHQEFRGAKMGAIESKVGDEYTWDTLCISGHVHSYQKLGRVLYTGSAFEHSFGSDKCFVFLIDDDGNMKMIPSNVVGKTTLYKPLVDGKVNIKIPTENIIPALYKCVISVERIEDYHTWLSSDQGRLLSRHYTLNCFLNNPNNINMQEDISYDHENNTRCLDLVQCFRLRVASKHPDCVETMQSLFGQ